MVLRWLSWGYQLLVVMANAKSANSANDGNSAERNTVITWVGGWGVRCKQQ